MWDYVIRESTFEELEPLRWRGRNEVDIAIRRNTKNTVWFVVDLQPDLVAFAGLISVRNNFEVVRFKAGYTLPEWRGQGFGRALVDHRIAYCESLKQCKEMQIFTVNPPFFQSLGWEFMNRARPSEMHRLIER